jgi:hypothetical protein
MAHACALQRVKGEEQREFLASRDAWFHPDEPHAHAEGHIAIVDFYREIIEDYSAIPRHLQQQYGVINGHDRGRIWILETEVARPKTPLSATDAQVLKLRENDDTSKIDLHADLQPQLALQLALSLGPQKDALATLARKHGQLRWMDAAIASSAYKLEKDLLLALAADPGQSEPVMANLAGILAARGNAQELTECLANVKTGKAHDILKLGLEDTQPLATQTDIPAPTAPTADQNAVWEKRVPAILAALKQKPNLEEGKTLFTAICGPATSPTASAPPSAPISTPSSNAPLKSSCATSSSPAKPPGPATKPSTPKRIAVKPSSASPPPTRPPASP